MTKSHKIVTRFELDPQQVREPEDGLTLPVGICVHHIRPDVGRVLRDKIENMMPLPGPTGNKAREVLATA
jgi:hypothetical protein